MLALLWFVSRDALAVDLLLGFPIRSDPFTAFTTEITNGVPVSEDVAVENDFRGEIGAAIPFHDLGTSAQWIVDVGVREWMASGPWFDAAAHEPHADVGVHLGTRGDEQLHAYAAIGAGVLVSIVTSSEWPTHSLFSPHAFLAAGVAFGGNTQGLVEMRVSPVFRDDTFTRETLTENGSAGLRFSPGGAALTFAAGVRFR